MRFWKNTWGMSGLVLGTVITLLLLFMQNAGMISLSVPAIAALWWLLAWPFTFAALLVAEAATTTQAEPGWAFTALLASVVLNLVYFYGLGRFVGFVVMRLRKSGGATE